MGASQTIRPAAGAVDAAQTGGTLPASVLDGVASRFRAAGLMVAALDRNGALIYNDSSAPPFLGKYATSILRSPGLAAAELSAAARTATATSAVASWQFLPGLCVAAFPHVDKRQVSAMLLLVGKRESFTLDEDLLRDLNRFGLDGEWVAKLADELPGWGADALCRQAKLMASMMRDQARLHAFEQEIDSLSTQLSNSYEELSLIYQVSSGMKVNRSAGDFFRQACIDVREVLNVRGMGVALCGDGSCKQDPVLYGSTSGEEEESIGPMPEVPTDEVNRLADELMTILRERKSPLLINDLANDARFKWFSARARHLIAVPLQRQEEVLGCLFGIDKMHGDFDSVDAKLLNSIANESAIYLENAMLFEDVRELLMGVMRSLTSAVDAKDTYTCGHSERVAILSRRLAQEIGLPERDVERIYMAGILHDVGKIGVPEAVLHKTGKLTAEEFEQMKKHPQIGARILSDLKQLEDVIPGVLHHHERFDGKGYPANLSGNGIPLMGRIICVADCFDAMTSNRTYRRALPLEVALIEVRRCAGTQFDPTLAEAFLRIKPEEFRSLLSEHQSRTPQMIPTPELAA
jgi:putative nucleotidyltransferase with HDIG domain